MECQSRVLLPLSAHLCCVNCSIRLNHTNLVHRKQPIMSLLLGYSLGLLNQTSLRILNPPMETPDPPNDTPGALQQVVLTPHDIPRILRVFPFSEVFFSEVGFFGRRGFSFPHDHQRGAPGGGVGFVFK